MSAADWWRVGYGHDFAQNVERIAASLEKQNKLLARLIELIQEDHPFAGVFESPPSTEADI